MARYDYTAVGHVTVDVLADGSRRAGGGAFYSALQASRLGLKTLIVTQGRRAQIEELLAPHAGELELEIHPAGDTTTLQTTGAGTARAQRVLSWAGPIAAPPALDTEILHLAPVAQETGATWEGHADFIALTAQGLVRSWRALGSRFSAQTLANAQLPAANAAHQPDVMHFDELRPADRLGLGEVAWTAHTFRDQPLAEQAVLGLWVGVPRR